ncbi:hypothetical protein RB195_011975 [Necator americanus]|uniref:Kunitz/Bovine pancreatic trypsin inhibitor domain protein n=1 Tax=Necator americanus TaxID=51031 RepID=A0ABR1D5Q9_NECAM
MTTINSNDSLLARGYRSGVGHHPSYGSNGFGSTGYPFGSSPYYGGYYGYGGGGGGLLSMFGGLLGFRQPYYSSPSYYYSNYQTSPYYSYYQPSSYSYNQPAYFQRAAYTCEGGPVAHCRADGTRIPRWVVCPRYHVSQAAEKYRVDGFCANSRCGSRRLNKGHGRYAPTEERKPA